MTQIKWRHDVDQALADAKAQRKPVLVDFTAAPM
jgi:thiol:disulfide interchange protein